MKRILSLAAAVVVLTTSVTFAQSPMQPNFCGKMKRHSHNEKIMGSVKSVDKDNSSFIVVNSDSVDIKVVINPKTRIIQLPKERPQIGDRPRRDRSQEGDRPQRDRSQEGDRPRRDRSHWGMNMVERPTPPPQLSLEDISVGDWVQVSVYESDTVAKDAIHVQVFKKN
ncbi:MAG: hypothetical protein IIW10_03970 [Spirochaetaceae bacterium]|nr:hypothetical protein [Spirochaetaceae bacterium]